MSDSIVCMASSRNPATYWSFSTAPTYSSIQRCYDKQAPVNRMHKINMRMEINVTRMAVKFSKWHSHSHPTIFISIFCVLNLRHNNYILLSVRYQVFVVVVHLFSFLLRFSSRTRFRTTLQGLRTFPGKSLRRKSFPGTALPRNITQTLPRYAMQTSPSPRTSLRGRRGGRRGTSRRGSRRAPSSPMHRGSRSPVVEVVREVRGVVALRPSHGGRELVQRPTAVAGTTWSVVAASMWHLVRVSNVFPGKWLSGKCPWNYLQNGVLNIPDLLQLSLS